MALVYSNNGIGIGFTVGFVKTGFQTNKFALFTPAMFHF